MGSIWEEQKILKEMNTKCKQEWHDNKVIMNDNIGQKKK
jgi:hypothetical protein